MQISYRQTLSFLVLAFVIGPFGYAQDESPVFTVAYIEVNPSSAERVRSLLKAHAEESRTQAGNLRFLVLQRLRRPNHFAILDAWESRQLQDDHAAAVNTIAFRAELDALLYSPYDERRSSPTLGTSAAGDEGEVYVLTHVDLAPRGVEQGLELLGALIMESRQEAGAKDIGLIVQDSRQNHMTLFEVWSSVATHEAHVSSAHTMRARNELQARIGSLYDERLYRRL